MASEIKDRVAQPSSPSKEVVRLGNRLLAAVREDVSSQERILGSLLEQERCVHRPTDPAFLAATKALESELERQPFRTIQRDGLLRSLGEEFGVEASALTLCSVAERLGPTGEPLLVERTRLHSVTTSVQRQNRRVAALIRTHRDVTREILGAILGDESGGDLLGGGTLIDAEV